MNGLTLWLLALPLMGQPGAKVILGRQVAEFALSPENQAFRLPSYRNNGFRQDAEEVAGGQIIHIESRNQLLLSKVASKRVILPEAGMAGLLKALNAVEHPYLADQVATLIDWLRREFKYETEFFPDQSPARLLADKSGNCVGFCNLALLVLRRMGVRARYVTGIAFKKEDRVQLLLEGRVLHRWIEIFYEDVGWVFCDPSGKVNFVEATYLILGIEGLHPLAGQMDRAVGTRVELLRFENGFQSVGILPNYESGVSIRPNRLFVYP